MSIRPLAGLLSVVALAACSDDGLPEPDSNDIADRLEVLPYVVSVDEVETGRGGGYRYFEIGFEQPVDHDDPDSQRFTQYLTLTHRDDQLPLVLGSTGYGNYYGDFPMEPTQLLSANQLIIEHRYFLPSRPQPADWNYLRVAQAAADHHAIAEAFHHIYEGTWISTGGSKGGMASIHHRFLYPDDVDATVAYVAPHNLSDADTRYDSWFDDTLPAECLQRVRDAQIDFLANRRDALVERASEQAEEEGVDYTRVALPVAVESAIAGIEWTFFQYSGVAYCDEIPGPGASDDEAWEWLAEVNHPDGLSDDTLAFFEPYFYQVMAELGNPVTIDEHLDGLLMFGDDDYAGADPPELPTRYDPSLVDEAARWLAQDAEDILLVYGEYDPWTAGAFDPGDNELVRRFTAAEGTHNVGLEDLAGDDRDAALAMLEAWTGITPEIPGILRSRDRAPRAREPRPPVRAWARALRARERARRH
jgi:PS-10 peptidase S37